MKILYVTTIGKTMGFFKAFIKDLLDNGHIVDIATNESGSPVPECYREWGCSVYPISTSRSPLNKGNFASVKQLKKLVSENGYDIVHCHTPNAAVATRLACRKLRKKRGLKVFYTAHGFHFYKGAPLKTWLIYYPIEKFCSQFTDTLITINKEDFELAKSKFKSNQICYVPGVGINVSKFADAQVDKNEKRKEIGVPSEAVILTSVGELIERKNHMVILRSLVQIKNDDLHYIVVGKGELLEELQAFVNDNGLSNRVHFLGYRKDVEEIYKASDVCCLPSIHEGLPVALMEAMASGLPCVASRIRGNTDLIDEKTGFLVDTYDVDGYVNAILQLFNDEKMRDSMGKENKNRAYKYSSDTIIEDMRSIYGC